MKDNVLKLAGLFLFCFLLLIFYLGYINVGLGPALAVDPHNRRLAIAEESIQRGTIYDRHGVVLAKTIEENGKKRRVYPQGAATAQVVGFVSARYGRAGLESAWDRYLLGLTGERQVLAGIARSLGRPWTGDTVVTTLDARLQKKALALLAGRRGAVVALVPESGELLVLASSPAYDPNGLDEVGGQTEDGKPLTRYQLYQNDAEAPLYNRATLGAYPPGSTFKLVTAAGVLTFFPEMASRVFSCSGSLEVDGFVLKDTAAHGEVDFLHALAVSCNVTFARLGLQLGPERLVQAARSFGFTENPWRDGDFRGVPYFSGSFPALSRMNKPQLASVAIGQGELLVSPLQMALVAAAVANDGILRRPLLVKEIRRPDGEVWKTTPHTWKTAVTPAVARILQAGMKMVVAEGTGQAARVPGVTVAGKTGSAQNPHGAPHAWFVGFAPADHPRLALAVIVENAGSGGTVAAPIARALIQEFLANN